MKAVAMLVMVDEKWFWYDCEGMLVDRGGMENGWFVYEGHWSCQGCRQRMEDHMNTNELYHSPTVGIEGYKSYW